MTASESKYIRSVDFSALAAAGAVRVRQELVDASSGTRACELAHVRTPAGGGSPEGLHVHDVDQLFYVISGTMFVEIDGVTSTVAPGSAVVFPAGVPHRNWNEEETVHLAFLAPAPDPSKQRTRRVDAGPADGPEVGR